jgi:hypothetical protein
MKTLKEHVVPCIKYSKCLFQVCGNDGNSNCPHNFRITRMMHQEEYGRESKVNEIKL